MRQLNQQNDSLWVEGNDDKHVIASLLNHRFEQKPFAQNDKATWIINAPREGGFEGTLRAFSVAMKNKRHERVGLVVDRDTAQHARWKQVKAELLSLGVEHPEQIPSEGLLASRKKDKPYRWGIWLMPDNQQHGEIEEFVLSLGPTHSKLFEHASTSIANAAGMPGAFRPEDRIRATLHSYLACVDAPGRPYGDAVARGHFGNRSAEADAFVTWFSRLFLEP